MSAERRPDGWWRRPDAEQPGWLVMFPMPRLPVS